MNLWPLVKRTFTEWNRHEAPRLGAALAFYTVLSLAPLVIVVLAIVSLALGESSAQAQLTGQVEQMVGADGADAVKGILERGDRPGAGLFASILGTLTLLFGASGVFGELRASLNTLWDLPAPKSSGIFNMIRERLLSFGMVLAIGFLLLVALIVSALFAAMGKFLGGLLPLPEAVMQAGTFVLSLAGITGLFGLILRYVPDTRMAWRAVWVGAFTTAVLFTMGKFLIGLYLGKATIASSYGAAGSLVVLIVWVYYSAQIFFFGAQFTQVYAERGAGRRTRSSPVAEAPLPVASHAEPSPQPMRGFVMGILGTLAVLSFVRRRGTS
jgi:membrane protein